jgi:DNA (cytosine-5)-methyltransferase 1
MTIQQAPCFVDIFAGCGGLSLGLKRAGWTGLFAIEKDPFAFETLISNFSETTSGLAYDWPESIECKPWDIHRLIEQRGHSLRTLTGRVDLLAGGPPCQGFSHAGRRRRDDPRNRLFEAYLELVAILKPKLVLVENVQGFTSDFQTKRKTSIKNFAAELQQQLSRHYDVTSSIIRASDFGVPQARPRFFLVGRRKGLPSPESLENFFSSLSEYSNIFLKARGLSRSPSARDAISDLEVRKNGTLPSPDTKGYDAIAYKHPLTAYQVAMHQGHSGRLSDTRLARHREEISERFAAIIRACKEEGRLNANLTPEMRKAFQLKKAALRVIDPLKPAPTITSLPDDLLHYSEPRTLTVRENARLQSFPDWFEFHGNYTTGGPRRRKEVPRFTQVANAVPPLLAEQIGLTLRGLLFPFETIDVFPKGIANNPQRITLSAKRSAKIRHPRFIDRRRGLASLDCAKT